MVCQEVGLAMKEFGPQYCVVTGRVSLLERVAISTLTETPAEDCRKVDVRLV